MSEEHAKQHNRIRIPVMTMEELIKQRDEALLVRDLARAASNRDLEAKRQAEAKLREVEALLAERAPTSNEQAPPPRVDLEAKIVRVMTALEMVRDDPWVDKRLRDVLRAALAAQPEKGE